MSINLIAWKDLLDLNITQFTINAMANTVKTYPIFAGDLDTTQWTTSMTQMGNIGPIEEIGTDEGPKSMNIEMGYNNYVTQKKWGFDIHIPYSVAKFANHIDEVIRWVENNGNIEGKARATTLRIEQMVAQRVAYANATTYDTAPDGYAMCYASHPINPNTTGTTYSNIQATTGLALNPTNVNALLIVINKCKDLVGEPADILTQHKAYLYCAPDLGMTAKSVLMSPQLAQSAYNDVNALTIKTGLDPNPVVWSRLSTTFQGTDANDWGIVIPDLQPYKVVWGARPEYWSYVDDKTRDYHFISNAFFNVKAMEPRGIFMNNYA